MLSEILNDNGWQDVMRKRGLFMLNFIADWANYVNETIIQKQNLTWYDIPGYGLMLKCFMNELIDKELKNFKDEMMNSSAALISNNIIIVFFLPELYRKTNVYESVQVFKSFDILNTWFSVLKKQKQPLPSTFEYDLFVKGIFIALQSDEGICIEKVLWFLYNNFGFFPTQIRIEFWEFLYGNCFMELF